MNKERNKKRTAQMQNNIKIKNEIGITDFSTDFKIQVILMTVNKFIGINKRRL